MFFLKENCTDTENKRNNFAEGSRKRAENVSIIYHRYPRVQGPESRVQSPESRVHSPESRVQSPESSPESSPGFRLCQALAVQLMSN